MAAAASSLAHRGQYLIFIAYLLCIQDRARWHHCTYLCWTSVERFTVIQRGRTGIPYCTCSTVSR